MVIVIAKTYEQYVRCCHQKNLNMRYVQHVTTAAQIEKLHSSVEPIFFGDFWNLPGYAQLEMAMRNKGIKVRGQFISPRIKSWGE